MQIRVEQPEDREAVREINIAAFEREGEANLVDRLRAVPGTFSFVAMTAEQVVGHVFFSPVTIDGDCASDLLVLGLAPVAVQPHRQRQGIGSRLIQHGLAAVARSGYQAVVVLGSSKYYPRFGFIPAKAKGLKCEYAVPDEAFMVLELEAAALTGCTGIVRYRPEFDGLE